MGNQQSKSPTFHKGVATSLSTATPSFAATSSSRPTTPSPNESRSAPTPPSSAASSIAESPTNEASTTTAVSPPATGVTPTEPWQQVLDDADDATAQLILQLQLEDAEAVVVAGVQDFAFAKALFEDDLKRYRLRRMFVIEEPKTCIICEDQFELHRCQVVPCGHYYCRGCLDELFGVAMKNEQAYPPRCCTQTVPLGDVRGFLDDKLAEEFADKKEELDDDKPTYCHVPKCSTYIGEDDKEENIATCPKCDEKTCILCKSAKHDGDCAKDEAVEETERLADSEGWKRCPQCQRIVELRSGCNHMM